MACKTDIVIVEDCAVQAARLRGCFEKRGYAVRVAADGCEALKLAHERVPDLVLSDVLMPGMDGFELCRHIKSSPRLRRVPVILLTLLSDPAHVLRGLECGADNFIVKPYGNRNLVARVEDVLGSRPPEDENPARGGVELTYGGTLHVVHSHPAQILNLLLTSYEMAVQKNAQLTEAQTELRKLNEALEERVEERGRELRREVEVRRSAERVVRDLNQTLEQRIADRTAHLQEAVESLDAFSHSVSHDLKAPLRAIQFHADALLEGQDDVKRRVTRIREQATHMAQLIEDILASARLHRQPLRRRAVHLGTLLASVLEDLAQTPRSKVLHLTVGELPDCQADPTMVREVLGNLVGNAIKFSRTRAVAQVEIGSLERSGECVYYVRDNGVGFDAQASQKIFSMFERLESAEAYEGTGIGLSIVASVVRRHGGRVWAEAEPDKGATFYFTLAEAPQALPRMEEKTLETSPA